VTVVKSTSFIRNMKSFLSMILDMTRGRTNSRTDTSFFSKLSVC
jgi:hypothetical protein